VDGPTNAFYAMLDSGVSIFAPFIAVGKSGGGDTPRWQGSVTNVWFQLVITYTSSTASLYVNGGNLMQATRTYGTTLAGHFYIGQYVNGGPPTFYGQISDVRIYNRALSSNEVQQLYAYESNPNPPLSVYTAIELDFFALPGQTYQIQNSGDLTNWFNIGSPITGNNQTIQQFFSTRGTNGQFFRVNDVTP